MLRSLQKKPAHIRAHIAFMTAFVVSILVMAFWVMTLPAKFAEMSEAGERASVARKEEDIRSAEATVSLSELAASTTDAYLDLRSQVNDIRGGVYEEKPVKEGSTDSDIIIIRETN